MPTIDLPARNVSDPASSGAVIVGGGDALISDDTGTYGGLTWGMTEVRVGGGTIGNGFELADVPADQVTTVEFVAYCRAPSGTMPVPEGATGVEVDGETVATQAPTLMLEYEGLGYYLNLGPVPTDWGWVAAPVPNTEYVIAELAPAGFGGLAPTLMAGPLWSPEWPPPAYTVEVAYMAIRVTYGAAPGCATTLVPNLVTHTVAWPEDAEERAGWLRDGSDATFIDVVEAVEDGRPTVIDARLNTLTRRVADRASTVTVNLRANVLADDGDSDVGLWVRLYDLETSIGVQLADPAMPFSITGTTPGDFTLTVTEDHLTASGATLADLLDLLVSGAWLLVSLAETDAAVRFYEATVTVGFECFARTVAPPLRQTARSDGLGASSARRQLGNRTVQRSLRQGPGSVL